MLLDLGSKLGNGSSKIRGEGAVDMGFKLVEILVQT